MGRRAPRLTLVAPRTSQTRIALRAHPRDIPDFQAALDVGAGANDFTDNLVPYDLGIHLGHVAPSGRHGVEVRRAYAAVQDLH